MKFELNTTEYVGQFWSPSTGRIGDRLAFDSETDLIQQGQIPDFILGSSYGGGNAAFLIKKEDLRDFFECHKLCTIIMHNAPFDMNVVTQSCNFDFATLVKNNRIFDTGLLYLLLRIAQSGKAPGHWSLDYLCKTRLGILLPKDDDVRLTYSRFKRNDNSIDYSAITPEHAVYALKDAVSTKLLFDDLFPFVSQLSPDHHCGHKIHLMGAIALSNISRLGIGVDSTYRKLREIQLDNEIEAVKNELATHGYKPGQKGCRKTFESIVARCGLNLPRTKFGQISMKADDIARVSADNPFLKAFLRHRDLLKIKSVVSNQYITHGSENRIFPKYRALVSTGRTASYRPNIQNLPRKNGIRECFVPAPGYCFAAFDYKQIELCALAQVTHALTNDATMKKIIDSGQDIHKWYAAILTGKDAKDITDEERRIAKACNFGFPGGLGISTFIEYARKTYDISLDPGRAKYLKDQWLDAFPEMKVYMADRFCNRFDFSENPYDLSAGAACGMAKRILTGNTRNVSGTNYTQKTLDWVFKSVLPSIDARFSGKTQGSAELFKQVSLETIQTRMGLIRGDCSYTQARNTPFQSIAAAGAKIALYRLSRSGERIVAFIHDEILIELPIDCDLDQRCATIINTMVTAMRAAIPDVKIDVEIKGVMDRWYSKPGNVRNDGGKIVIYSDPEYTQSKD
jgi:DNA polymerase I-like protein with 3'-5' exonuclease and polymerase domains